MAGYSRESERQNNALRAIMRGESPEKRIMVANVDKEFQDFVKKEREEEQKRIIEFSNIKIDLNKLLIHKESEEFKINNTEKIILERMINNPGKTFSREDIGKLINIDKERSVDVIITRLRKKIELDPKNPKFLQTLRGSGYVLWIE